MDCGVWWPRVRFDRGCPDAGAEGVAGDGVAVAGGEQQVTVGEAVRLDVVVQCVQQLGA